MPGHERSVFKIPTRNPQPALPTYGGPTPVPQRPGTAVTWWWRWMA
jgi:hypothetical protein